MGFVLNATDGACHAVRCSSVGPADLPSLVAPVIRESRPLAPRAPCALAEPVRSSSDKLIIGSPASILISAASALEKSHGVTQSTIRRYRSTTVAFGDLARSCRRTEPPGWAELLANGMDGGGNQCRNWSGVGIIPDIKRE